MPPTDAVPTAFELGEIGVTGTRTRATRIGVVVVVLALAAGVFVVHPFSGSSAGAAPVTQPTATTTTTAPPGPMDAAAKEVEAFVEETRGLKFIRPVKVTLADDATFKSRLLGHEQPDKAEVDKATGEMRALGFVPAGFDLVKAVNDSASSDVVGFYDFKAKDLVVRGNKVTPYVKEVLAHELTHAVDDQHFTLDRPSLSTANDEQDDSFTALTEGDAVHVQLAYYDAMSAADKANADSEENGYGGTAHDGAQSAPALGDFGIYPYTLGARFVDQILKAHGQAALDGAFANPPTSSAQILVPDRYFDNMPGASDQITPPPADGTVIDKGVIGQFGLFVMLRQTMGDDIAGLAASTWEGDTYVAWRDGAKTCVRARFLTDSAPSAFPLAVMLKMWVDKQGGGTVEEPGTVILTTCR
jgi:hypothetical protein